MEYHNVKYAEDGYQNYLTNNLSAKQNGLTTVRVVLQIFLRFGFPSGNSWVAFLRLVANRKVGYSLTSYLTAVPAHPYCTYKKQVSVVFS